MSSTTPVAGSPRGGGVHSATSCGATSQPAATVSNGASPPSGRQTIPGGEPNASAASPDSSTAIHGPGQENVRGSGTGIRPIPRVASHPRHGVHGSPPSAGTGTSATSTSRMAARHAANDRSCGGPAGGMASGMRTGPGCLSRRAAAREVIRSARRRPVRRPAVVPYLPALSSLVAYVTGASTGGVPSCGSSRRSARPMPDPCAVRPPSRRSPGGRGRRRSSRRS